MWPATYSCFTGAVSSASRYCSILMGKRDAAIAMMEHLLIKNIEYKFYTMHAYLGACDKRGYWREIYQDLIYSIYCLAVPRDHLIRVSVLFCLFPLPSPCCLPRSDRTEL